MFRQDLIREARELAGKAVWLNPHFNPQDGQDWQLTAEAIGHAKKAGHLQRRVFHLLSAARLLDAEYCDRTLSDKLPADAEPDLVQASAMIESALTLAVIACSYAAIAQSWALVLFWAKDSHDRHTVSLSVKESSELFVRCHNEPAQCRKAILAAHERLKNIDTQRVEQDAAYARDSLKTTRAALAHAKLAQHYAMATTIAFEAASADESAGILTR